MLSGIKKKNEQFVKHEWPRAKTAELLRPKNDVYVRGLVADVFSPKIKDKIIVRKNTNTGFDNLEARILIIIFSYFEEKELLYNICGVSRHWYNVARNPKLWKELEFKAERTDTTTKCNFLWKSPELERLSLNDMKNPLTVIRHMCRCNRSLKHLKIKNCRGGESERIPESVLRNILHSCRKLESLDLNGTQFTATRFYHELANLPNLRKLNLDNSKYLLAKDLVTIALNCRHLEDISIVRAEDSQEMNSLCISDQDAVFLFKNLSHSLKRVQFDTTGLTGPAFEAILSCPNLEKLSLRHALFLSGEILRNHISKLRGLKQLRITQAIQLVSDDLIFLSDKLVFDHLNLLDISGSSRITDTGLRSLLQRCKDRITYLNLKSCKSIRDLYFIINNCTKLQYLNIAHSISLDPSHADDLTSNIQKLSRLVIDDQTLSKIDLKTLLSRAPRLKLIRSMSEFHKDESIAKCLQNMAELHIIGQIKSAEDFQPPHLFCKWSFHIGGGWKLIDGNAEGQTQECCDFYTNIPVWDHPIDLHYTTQTLQGSPKLLLQIFCRDEHGRVLFIAYGVSSIPLTPGAHSISCHTWKPIGDWQDRLRDRFLGMSLQLKSPNALANTEDRFELLTQTMGTVNIDLHILARNFDKFGCRL